MNNETPPSGIPTPPSGTPPQETPNPRAGRARERQMRRQRAPMAQPSGARRLPRQTAPSDRFKLPNIKLPNRIYLYAAGSVLLVLLVVYVLGRLRNEPDETPPNAIWIGLEWTHELHEDGEIQEFVRRLREQQIGTVYAWVSWLQDDQTWRSQDKFAAIEAFVEQFKRLYPEARLFGWVSVPNDTNGIAYRLDNVVIQQIIADFSAQVVNEFGFDGVHLNIETVWNDDQNFLAVLRKVRSSVGPEVPVSTAVPPDWSPVGADIPVPPLIVPGTVWNIEYKKSVALLVEEIAIMAYNSGLSTADDYTAWMAYQVNAYTDAISGIGGGTELVIGIPTYDDDPPGHLTAVETIPAAIAGIREGLRLAEGNADYVRGAAIYAEWTTDDAEWTQYRQSWLRR